MRGSPSDGSVAPPALLSILTLRAAQPASGAGNLDVGLSGWNGQFPSWSQKQANLVSLLFAFPSGTAARSAGTEACSDTTATTKTTKAALAADDFTTGTHPRPSATGAGAEGTPFLVARCLTQCLQTSGFSPALLSCSHKQHHPTGDAKAQDPSVRRLGSSNLTMVLGRWCDHLGKAIDCTCGSTRDCASRPPALGWPPGCE